MANKPLGSVTKALGILQAFDSRTPDLSLSELSRRMGFPKSVTYKLLWTLRAKGFLQRDDATRRYRIGPAILVVAGAFLNSDPLLKEGSVVLRELSQKTGHTATLGILDRSEVLFIAVVDGTHIVRASAKIGDRRPLHATATGKILLSGLSDPDIDRLLGPNPLSRLTANTITSKETLKRHLESVRKTGIAYNLRERTEEISSIAAAVFNHTHEVVTGIAITFPSTLETPETLSKLTGVVKAHGLELSRRLGAGLLAKDDHLQTAASTDESLNRAAKKASNTGRP